MSDLRNATLSHIVADVLRQSLYDGVYLCGDRLVELTISQEMNVSQNTARDALGLLENEGWVTRKARHGVYVQSFNVDEVSELVMLRAALEKLALGWALDRTKRADIARLREFLDNAQNYAEVQNIHAVRDVLLNFHRHIVTLSAKNQTAVILNRLLNQSRLLDNLRYHHVDNDVLLPGSLEFYDLLLTHIRDDDHIAAQNALKAIILDEGEALLSVLTPVLEGEKVS